MSKDYTEKQGFRFREQSGECVSFIRLDTSFNHSPVNDIWLEMDTHFRNMSMYDESVEQFVWNNLLERVGYDRYGSIMFEWNYSLMDWLTTSQLEFVSETINDAFQGTDFFQSLSTMKSYEEGYADINNSGAIVNYVEAIKECGYTIDWDNVKEMVPEKLHTAFEEYKTVELLKEQEQFQKLVQLVS